MNKQDQRECADTIFLEKLTDAVKLLEHLKVLNELNTTESITEMCDLVEQISGIHEYINNVGNILEKVNVITHIDNVNVSNAAFDIYCDAIDIHVLNRKI